ncbi:MAG: hypothetical protein PHQ65_17585 [Bacteroidales bacterium]|nr:hypothetical protein [Bacteroidales bacterium]
MDPMQVQNQQPVQPTAQPVVGNTIQQEQSAIQNTVQQVQPTVQEDSFFDKALKGIVDFI